MAELTLPTPGRSLLPMVAAALCLALLGYLTWPSIELMYNDWMLRPEYSHGILVPAIVAYLLYVRRDLLVVSRQGRYLGVAVFGVGLFFVLAGVFGTIHALTQLALVLCLIGLFYSLFGTASWRQSLIPLFMLFFMVPLPHFLHQAASAQLQLWSSQLGVYFIRLFDISVYLQGNVIDLGTYQLQVLEACDGLRYLFPLLTLSFLFAYIYRGPIWQRVLLFLSAIPITVLMNSFRIAMIGWMVDNWGSSMAEGFIHDFQGWVIFLVCVGVLLVEAKVLSYWAPQITGFGDMFELEPDSTRVVNADERAPTEQGVLLAPWVCVAMLFGGLLAHNVVVAGATGADSLQRKDFLEFPLALKGGWQGRRGVLEHTYIQRLRLDDYLMADYQDPLGRSTNVYVAYYDSQTGGSSVHSPKTCLPGGGWEMQEFSTVNVEANGDTIPINRVIIGKGPARQLVYYWFEQRGRVISNEYLVKWYLLLDAISTGRSDGALVRLISPLPVLDDSPEAEARHDEMLRELVGSVRDVLPTFVPE